MNDKAEEIMVLSDNGDAGDCDDGVVSPTPITVPKKRGRTANSEKPKKVPSGRGRGRPSKAVSVTNKKPVKAAASADGSEEEVSASDSGSPVPNGGAVESKRGRRPKSKLKLVNTIIPSGKGRGRPKKIPTTDMCDNDDDSAEGNEDGASSDYKPGKKNTAKATKKGRGRPKKVADSGDESSDDKHDDDVVRRPVGRPPSGAVNLNILRTGKGQGRPTKKVAAKRAADAENGGGEKAKKPGRPATSGKGPYTPTGNPRGRPKLSVQNKDSQDDNEDADVNISKEVAENSAEEDDKADSDGN